jgi:hypothetical protein
MNLYVCRETVININLITRTLFVHIGLFAPLANLKLEKVLGNEGIPGGHFVHTGSSVSHVLTGKKDWHLDMELELHHFKRGGVPVSHEVSDEPSFRSRCSGS